MEVIGNQDGKIDITPCVSDQKDDIAEKLVEAGPGKDISCSSTLSSLPAESIAAVTSYANPIITKTESAYCTFVHSAMMISIQLQKYEHEVNEVMERLATYCENAKDVENVVVGTVCASLFSDDIWYRAEVTSVRR